jgi:phage shock protein C
MGRPCWTSSPSSETSTSADPGVVAGPAHAGIDPWPARLLFVLLGIALHASLIPIYVILWILMPADGTAPATVWPADPPASPLR